MTWSFARAMDPSPLGATTAVEVGGAFSVAAVDGRAVVGEGAVTWSFARAVDPSPLVATAADGNSAAHSAVAVVGSALSAVVVDG